MYKPRHSGSAVDSKLLFFLCSIAVFLLDQYTKRKIVASLGFRESLPVIPGFFHLTYIMNSGASFGILQERPMLFVITNILAIATICWIVYFWKGIRPIVRILMGFVVGGAMGNLTDRMQYGAVVDFLDFRGIWPYIFNLADMALVCAGLSLALLITLEEWRDARQKPKH